MEPGYVCHGFVFFIHRKEAVNHEQNLAASYVALLSLPLQRLSLLNFLPEEVCISRDTLHQGSKQKRVEAYEASGLRERFKGRFRFFSFQGPSISLRAI